MVRVDRRAVGSRHVERVEQILDADRQTVQESRSRLRVERACAAHRTVDVDVRPRPDHGLALADALEAIGQQRHCRDLSRRELARGLGGGQAIEVSHLRLLP